MVRAACSVDGLGEVLMSERSKERRKVRDAKQEKQANRVVNWIFGVLVALAIIFMIAITISQS